MIKKISSLILAASFLAACSENAPVSNIQMGEQQQGVIGGDKVQAGSSVSRSTVGLYDSGSQSLCTGTLISDQLVLTAAHCVTPNSDKMIVYFGRDFGQKDQSLVRPVVKSVVHPNYNNNYEDMHDVALIRFSGGLPSGFAPAPLLKDFSVIQKGTRVVVAGYGLNWAWGIKKGAGVLRTTDLKVEQALYGRTEIVLDQSIRKGICSGDSGGPAYLEVNGQLYLLGVASRGDSLPTVLTPKCFMLSVFARVDAFSSWIQSSSDYLMSAQ